MALRPPGEERRRAQRVRVGERAVLVVVDDGEGLVASEHVLIDLSVQAIALRVDDPPPPAATVAVFLPRLGPIAVLGAVRPVDPDRAGVLVMDVLDRDGQTAERLAALVPDDAVQG